MTPTQLRFLRGLSVAVVAVTALLGIGPAQLQIFHPPDVQSANYCGGGCPVGTYCTGRDWYQYCGDDPNYCGTGVTAVRVGQCSGAYYCTADNGGTSKLVCGKCGYVCGTSTPPVTPPAPPPLDITDVGVAIVSSNQATIVWTTNNNADGKVAYGKTNLLELGQIEDPLTPSTDPTTFSKSHSVVLGAVTPLDPGTTYFYQVVSTMASGETKTSEGDRYFTTAGGGTSGPTILSGPFVDAIDNRATVTFRTDPRTASLVEFTPSPSVSLTPPLTEVCNDAVNCAVTPPDTPPLNRILATDHRIVLSGLTTPSSVYHYRITLKDASGAIFVSGTFEFKTSASSTDHVFTTGSCSDLANTGLLQCTADGSGKYCRAGGGLPVYDCRPDIPCPHPCPGGATCQPTGDCSKDPALTGSPTQCNPKKCYQKCDISSGRMSGKSCLVDGDCSDPGPPAKAGKCISGNFTSPAAVGCYASWPPCAANTILQVQPDRVCDKWLTCRTSQPVKDSTGKTENVCYDLTMCGALDQTGQCKQIIEGRQCSNDPLRFCTRDTDCVGTGATCLPRSAVASLTFSSPEQVDKIKYLTGYVRAGLDWHAQSGAPRIEGYYPLSMAKQVGSAVKIPNAGFEEYRMDGHCSKQDTKACSSENDCLKDSLGNDVQWGPCVYAANYTSAITDKNWEALPPGGTTGADAKVNGSAELRADQRDLDNNFMVVKPKDGTIGSGVHSIFPFTTTATQSYTLSVRLRSTENDLQVKALLSTVGGIAKEFDTVRLTTGWQTFRMGPIRGPGGPSEIQFTTVVATTPATIFYVDDVMITPSLQVNGATLISQSCRLYPKEDSPACRYIDVNGVEYRGLRGYCLERDPLNDAACISWWPVDVVAGENNYGDQIAGYSDRRPLYMCSEAFGRAKVSGIPSGCTTGGCWSGEAWGQNVTTSSYWYGGVVSKPCECSFGKELLGVAGNMYHMPKSAILEVNLYNGKNNAGFFSWAHADASQFTRAARTSIAYAGGGAALVAEECVFGGSCDYAAASGGMSGPGETAWIIDAPGNIAYVLFFDKDDLLYAQLYQVAAGGEWTMVVFGIQEQCKQLTLVADLDKDKAWVDRTSSSSLYKTPDLNFRYGSDLSPFGGAVITQPGDPSSWTLAKPLPIEAAQVDGSALIPPYQERGGSAYACFGSCDTRRCMYDFMSRQGFGDVGNRSNQTDRYCAYDSQCTFSSGGTTYYGKCVGNGFCGQWDPVAKKYALPAAPRNCVATSNCPANFECIGGAATGKNITQAFTGDNSSPNQNDAQHYSQFRLQRLFAEAYGVWTWDPKAGKYLRDPVAPSIPWTVPDQLCKVCDAASGPQKDLACTADTQCAGGACVLAARHPIDKAATAPDSADYCAVKPRATNVGDAGKEFELSNGQLYTVHFNSSVDREQTPLRAIRIDWGDAVTSDDVSIAPLDDPNNPHLYTHVYTCNETYICRYQIRIQLQDNWGWCSNGIDGNKCDPHSTVWSQGPVIIVRR